MAKIGVRWLEPERDVGKTTFVNVKDLICDRSKNLPAGSIVEARWKSSGRIYRAALLSNLMAKSTKKQKPDIYRPVVTEVSKGNPESTSDSDDDVPLALHTHGHDEHIKVAEMPELREQVNALQEKVSILAEDMKIMKENVAVEIADLKDTLLQGQRDMAAQIQTLLSVISEHHATTQKTNDLINGRISARKEAKENDRTLLTNNGKRVQPAFGRREDGNVVAYNEHGESLLKINAEFYRKTFDDSKTGTSFLRKLLKYCFTDNELAESNFSGGTVTSINGMTIKKCLDRGRVYAILGQVELEFPQSTKGKSFIKMRDAVNEECRRVARQIRLGQEPQVE